MAVEHGVETVVTRTISKIIIKKHFTTVDERKMDWGIASSRYFQFGYRRMTESLQKSARE